MQLTIVARTSPIGKIFLIGNLKIVVEVNCQNLISKAKYLSSNSIIEILIARIKNDIAVKRVCLSLKDF